MSYTSISSMANSSSLRSRVIACAAQEGHPNPEDFAARKMLQIVADAAWVDAWDYATGAYNVNQNPDTGARVDVINDAMILSRVQPRIEAEVPPPAP